jgi:hypothetical protein
LPSGSYFLAGCQVRTFICYLKKENVMGLFGNDKEQDARLDAIEDWLQGLTGVVQKNHLAASQLRIDLMKLQSSVDEKLAATDFDPTVMKLNDSLAQARVKYEAAKSAAADNWTDLQKGAMQALEALDQELQEAADRMDDDNQA